MAASWLAAAAAITCREPKAANAGAATARAIGVPSVEAVDIAVRALAGTAAGGEMVRPLAGLRVAAAGAAAGRATVARPPAARSCAAIPPDGATRTDATGAGLGRR